MNPQEHKKILCDYLEQGLAIEKELYIEKK